MGGIIFICLECFSVFEEPKRCYGEWLEHFGTPCREEHDGSPCCESAFVEAHECSECGEYIIGDYIKIKSGDRICEGCYAQYSIGDEE